MGKYTKEQLEEKYKKIPPVLQDALYSTETASKLYNIGKKFGLTIEKIGFVAEEAGYVILGFTRPEDFAGILKGRIELNDNQARDLAADISREVFYPLRDVLKSVHNMNVEAGGATPKEIPPFMRGMREPEGAAAEHNVIMPRGAAASGPPKQDRIPTVDLRVPSEKIPPSAPTEVPPAPPKPISSPVSTEPKPAAIPISKPATGQMPPPTKNIEPIPISPPPPVVPKIPPIDLRTTNKPPSPAPVEKQPLTPPPPPNLPTTSPNTLVLEKKGTSTSNPTMAKPSAPASNLPTNKKIPDKGIDPYREPVE